MRPHERFHPDPRARLDALDLRQLDPRGFFESFMVIHLRPVGAVIKDVPIPARYGDLTSHLSITRTLIEFPRLLLRRGLRRIFWQYFVAGFNVVSLFLRCRNPLVVVGIVFSLYHWVDSLRPHGFTSTGTVTLVVLPRTPGFQLLL